MKRVLILLVVVLAALVFGCAPRSTPPGADFASGGVSEEVRYEYMRWNEGLAVLIWHDLLYGSSGNHGSGSTTDPVFRVDGFVESGDGIRLDWEVETTEGKTAQFRLNDVSYDLTNGTMFFVSTANGELDIRMQPRDLSGVLANQDSVEAFARQDPDVLKFINRAATSALESTK